MTFVDGECPIGPMFISSFDAQCIHILPQQQAHTCACAHPSWCSWFLWVHACRHVGDMGVTCALRRASVFGVTRPLSIRMRIRVRALVAELATNMCCQWFAFHFLYTMVQLPYNSALVHTPFRGACICARINKLFV